MSLSSPSPGGASLPTGPGRRWKRSGGSGLRSRGREVACHRGRTKCVGGKPPPQKRGNRAGDVRLSLRRGEISTPPSPRLFRCGEIVPEPSLDPLRRREIAPETREDRFLHGEIAPGTHPRPFRAGEMGSGASGDRFRGGEMARGAPDRFRRFFGACALDDLALGVAGAIRSTFASRPAHRVGESGHRLLRQAMHVLFVIDHDAIRTLGRKEDVVPVRHRILFPVGHLDGERLSGHRL